MSFSSLKNDKNSKEILIWTQRGSIHKHMVNILRDKA